MADWRQILQTIGQQALADGHPVNPYENMDEQIQQEPAIAEAPAQMESVEAAPFEVTEAPKPQVMTPAPAKDHLTDYENFSGMGTDANPDVNKFISGELQPVEVVRAPAAKKTSGVKPIAPEVKGTAKSSDTNTLESPPSLETINTVDNLADAQRRKGDVEFVNRLGRAGEVIGAGIAGQGAKPVAQELFNEQIKGASSITDDFEKRAEKEKDDPNSPISAQFREFVKQFGVTLPSKTSATAASKIMPYAYQKFAASEAQKSRHEENELNRKAHSDDLKYRYDALKAAKEASAAEKAAKGDDALTLKLKDDLDPNKARGGNLAKSQAMVNSAERIEGLMAQFPDGNIPKAQTVELATSIAGLVSGGGGAQSQKQIDEIVPHSMIGDSNKIASWITGEPRGSQQQKFINLMKETAAREREIAEHQVKRSQIQRLSAYSGLKQKRPEVYNSVLEAYGIDPSEINEKGQYAPKAKAQVKTEAPAVKTAAPAKTEVERLDPKTGKTAIFDATTKQFLRYK